MAKRQEQEEAQSAVTEVAPDVLRMQLPIQMPGSAPSSSQPSRP